MTYKQIESSREVRLWIGQIVVPAVTLVAAAMITMPELREAVVGKLSQMKKSVKKTFQRTKA